MEQFPNRRRATRLASTSVALGVPGVTLMITLAVAGASLALAQTKAPASPGAKGEPQSKEKPEASPKAGAKPGQRADADKKKPAPPREGTMTIARMDQIIRRLDKDAVTTRSGSWQFKIDKRPVVIVTDVVNNRMRILSPVSKTEGIPNELLMRMMQANFDTALDARYAIARGIVWATFIHPLQALHDRQFISAIGQTVNLAETFGTTFSSGAISFGGGDSRDIIRKKLIEKLLKKGLPI